jgi:hypothetical protein
VRCVNNLLARTCKGRPYAGSRTSTFDRNGEITIATSREVLDASRRSRAPKRSHKTTISPPQPPSRQTFRVRNAADERSCSLAGAYRFCARHATPGEWRNSRSNLSTWLRWRDSRRCKNSRSPRPLAFGGGHPRSSARHKPRKPDSKHFVLIRRFLWGYEPRPDDRQPTILPPAGMRTSGRASGEFGSEYISCWIELVSSAFAQRPAGGGWFASYE